MYEIFIRTVPTCQIYYPTRSDPKVGQRFLPDRTVREDNVIQHDPDHPIFSLRFTVQIFSTQMALIETTIQNYNIVNSSWILNMNTVVRCEPAKPNIRSYLVLLGGIAKTEIEASTAHGSESWSSIVSVNNFTALALETLGVLQRSEILDFAVPEDFRRRIIGYPKTG